MVSLTKSSLAVIVASALFAAGCQSSGGTSASASADVGVTCEKCKTTYAQSPVTSSGNTHERPVRIIGERTVATHECPECKQVATDYLQQGKNRVPGKLVHACKLCGGEMKTCHVS